MAKKFPISSSIHDDAFGAEEERELRRKAALTGDELSDDMIDAEDEFGDEEVVIDSTDDPVRMYLMQMGQIPLLSRDQEISAAKSIEAARDLYRQMMMATDFMLQSACKLLEQVRDGKLRLDRTIEVSVTNASAKKSIMKRIGPNVETLRHLLEQNRADFLTAVNRKVPMSERRAAWRRLVVRRNKAVRLVEEMDLRTTKLQPLFERVEEISRRMGEIHRLLRDPVSLKAPGMPDAGQLRSELRQLMQ